MIAEVRVWITVRIMWFPVMVTDDKFSQCVCVCVGGSANNDSLSWQ